MAAIIYSTLAPPSSSALSFGERLRNGLKAIRNQIAYRRTLATLETLSPRQLADIGLEGVDVRSIAWRTAHETGR